MGFLVSGGTISVSAGETAVTGTGTAFSQEHVGVLLVAGGMTVPIASVESNTALTLSQAWPGTTLTDGDYDLLLYGPAAAVISAAYEQVFVLLNALSLKGEIRYVTTEPLDSFGDDGDTAINLLTKRMYRKADGSWTLVWDGVISSPDVSNLVVLTQAAYDALSPADANTLYAITEA